MNIIDLSFCGVLKLNSGDLRFSCLEAQTVTEKQSNFKVFFIAEIGHRPGCQTQIAPRAKRGLTKEPGLHYDYPVAALWRWRKKGGTWTLLETAFTSFFLWMVPWVIGNLSLARYTFVQKELVHSLAEHLTPVNKVNNLNVNYLKILKTHRGPTAANGPRVWDPCHRHCLATIAVFPYIYLLRLSLHCDCLITIMWSVNAFINDFTLTCRRKKNSLGQVIAIRPVHSLKSVTTSIWC